jgi:hypothetical protein
VNSCCFLDQYGTGQVSETLVTPLAVPSRSNELASAFCLPCHSQLPHGLEGTWDCHVIHF